MRFERTGWIDLLVSLAALGTAVYALVSLRESGADEITAEEASKVVKRHASDQQVTVALSEEQLEAIQEQWLLEDPTRPADITFVVEDRPEANVKVASYSYWGDTCCV